MKKVVGLVCMLLLVAGLAACGGSSDAKDTAKSKEIIFWNPFTGPDGANMQKMVDAYNKTNPEFKVKNMSLKEGDMYTKIPTVVNSGKNIPDLTIVHAERIKQYVDNDMLMAYDDYLADFPDFKAENYVPEAWNIGQLENRRYSIPLDIHSFIMYYNKDLVEKYVPTALDDNVVTFDEIKAAGELAKKDKIDAVSVSWVKPTFLSLYAQNGGKLTENGVDPTLDNQQAKDTFNLWKGMYKDGITTKDGEDYFQKFIAGKVIFAPEGIWMQNTAKDAKFDWGITNAPQLSGDKEKMVNWSSSHQFTMFHSKGRSKEKTKGVLAFLDWVQDNSLEWAKSGQNPASLKIIDDPTYKKMPQSFLLLDPTEQKSLKIFDYKYNGYVSEQLDANGNDIIFGKTPVNKGLADMQHAVEDKISKDKSNK
ncbi:extracellular solute-binding protein [Listeria grandensis]|uniref:Extracellular solute-binding protein n=1 Tax=Listeria grandensis TaxID=1494963 RepID=A0A7X1CQR4_9LIST|nr:extracellular solute-binding protein [Listeria grandensis]MBC1937301.1 extracellular solute-binding protein [Listeria grandensis]